MNNPLEILNLSEESGFSRLRSAQVCTLICYAGLLLLFVYLNLSQVHGSFSKWLMQSVPLLVVLPGLIRNNYRAYSWLCFIVLLYFTAYVAEVMSPLYVWTDAVALTFSVILFIGAMLTSRWLQRTTRN